jgi:hypothetical protein
VFLASASLTRLLRRTRRNSHHSASSTTVLVGSGWPGNRVARRFGHWQAKLPEISTQDTEVYHFRTGQHMKNCPRALIEHAFRNLEVYGAEAVTNWIQTRHDPKDSVVRKAWKRRKAPHQRLPGVAGWGRFSVEEKPSQV